MNWQLFRGIKDLTYLPGDLLKSILFSLIFLVSLSAFSQSLVISDVDDTLKLANAPSYTGSIGYAIDEYSHFTGLDSLFQLIKRDNPEVSFFYVSKAPEWLLKTIHENFLIRAGFPSGTYIGQTQYSAQEHKLLTIRALLNTARPQRVLFIGDNGQQDAQVYAQIAHEFPQIEFSQYIHIVYTPQDLWEEMIPLAPEQTGFVTSIELTHDLVTHQWLQPASETWMRENILPRILEEVPGGEAGTLAFPSFMNCHDIVWQWDIPGLNEKIKEVCGL